MYTIKDIRQIIEGLRYFYPDLSIVNIITDLESALEKFGVDVQYSFMAENKDISGYLTYENNKPTIVINAGDSFERQRFTMAHELGHLILHWNWLPDDETTLKNKNIYEVSYRNKPMYTQEEVKKETEANTFAAEFLVPESELEKEIRLDDENAVKKISKKFKVSNQCAALRVYKLLVERTNE